MRQKKKYDRFIGLRISKGAFKGLELIANKKKISVSELIRFLISGITGALLILFLAQPCIAETASWYSVESTKKEGTWAKYGGKTANGEMFSDTEFTCASWDYNFGVLLLVTNLKNNRTVICKVNDRGPNRKLYKQGRTLDLSKRAFAQIASLEQGIIQIKVRRVTNG